MNQNRAQQPEIFFGPLVLGSLICIASLLLFGLLAAGIGLASFNLERGELPKISVGWIGLAVGAVVLVASFFLGGFASSRLAGSSNRSGAVWQGLGSWSFVVVIFALAAGNVAATLGASLAKASAGVGIAAGAAGSLDEIYRQVSKARIITDLSVLKGKAVSQIVVPKGGEQRAGIAAREAPRQLEHAKRSAQQAGEKAREAGVGVSLGLFGALVLGAIAATLGGFAARRFNLREVPGGSPSVSQPA